MSLASYALFILLIAVSNAALGFGGAVLLGHGPRLPRIQCDWRKWLSPIMRLWTLVWERLRARRATAHAQATPPPASEQELPAQTLTPIQFSNPAPARKPIIDDSLSLDAALAQLSGEVAAVRSELSGLDDRVRSCTAAPTVGGVEECVADLKQTGQRLYEQQTQAIAAAQEAFASAGIAGTSCGDARETVEQRTDELRQSLAELDAWQVDPNNLADDCLRLLAATEQMMVSCDEVGQVLTSASTKQNEHNASVGNELGVKKPYVHEQQLIYGVARN